MLTDGISQTGYMRVYNFEDDKVWDDTNSQMDDLGSVAVADCSVAVTYDSTHQLGTITLPNGLPDEKVYVVKLYNKAVGDADTNDTADKTLWVRVDKHKVEWFSSYMYPIVR